MIETSNLIANAKENYYKNEGKKLLDSSLGPKKYWSILNSFLINKKMPTIPPFFENGESVVDYPTKAETSNNYFVSMYPPRCRRRGASFAILGHHMASLDTTWPPWTPHGLLGHHMASLDTTWPPWTPHGLLGHHMASLDTTWPPWTPHGLLGHHMASLDTTWPPWTPHGLLGHHMASLDTTWPPWTPHGLLSITFSQEKILNIIRALDSNKSSGWDGVSPRMIKICDSSIVNPLLIIFETCIREGIFPDNLKENYRPISLLPILDKMFVKVLFESLYDYFINNNLLTPCQSGFIKGDSCVNQLLAITHEIQKTLDANPSTDTIGVFFDMSKAFDKVWHNGLICKLQSYGIQSQLFFLLKKFGTMVSFANYSPMESNHSYFPFDKFGTMVSFANYSPMEPNHSYFSF